MADVANISTETLLNAYASGYFPMAEDAQSDQLYWFSPEERGVIPLDGFHLPRSVRRLINTDAFEIRVNTAFEETMRACAAPDAGRETTWINEPIIALYTELHAQGFAYSVECYYEDELAGGLYGVSLGGAFFGESMFSRYSGASKVALAALVAILKRANYTLLDTQYVNDHLTQFGCNGIPKKAYLGQLDAALKSTPNASTFFNTAAEDVIGASPESLIPASS